MSVAADSVQRLDRRSVERFLPELDAWLLPGSVWSVQHTWPQLYRSDGDGAFFAILDGDRLLSHCACRVVTLRDHGADHPVGLLGSVATAPDHRGRGLATRVLEAALDHLAPHTDAVLLWAERPELYRRRGFVDSAADRCLLLARRPRREAPALRLATVADHAALHALHERKPQRVARSFHEMSALLTTPGLTTVVLDRGGDVTAYACTGKAADLGGHWHELGGDDDELAELLPAALHLAGQTEAALLLPPYRPRLAELLHDHVVGEVDVPGPMVRATRRRPERCWVDGLDSV